MNDFVAQQFSYAKTEGWLPFFQKSAKDYDFTPALLMAIASRETNMRNIIGDRGHGFGCMQIDVRSFPEWVYSGAWERPAESIERGAQVLDSKLTQIHNGAGKYLRIVHKTFLGKSFPTAEIALQVAAACYNAGLWPYYSYSTGAPIDQYTTGHNYSSDVWSRMLEFDRLLKGEPNP